MYVCSTWAVAVLATIDAVGCWICISWSRTLPSLVILMSPEPDTSIFMVPLGPRFVFKTSWRPLAALMLKDKAWAELLTWAFGLSRLMADIFLDTSVEAFSKFTRRRTDGPGVQKRSKAKKIKLCLRCLPILPESSRIFQRSGKLSSWISINIQWTGNKTMNVEIKFRECLIPCGFFATQILICSTQPLNAVRGFMVRLHTPVQDFSCKYIYKIKNTPFV